jgi:hypothetical protein
MTSLLRPVCVALLLLLLCAAAAASPLPAGAPRVSVNVVDALWAALGQGEGGTPAHMHDSLRQACFAQNLTFIRVAGTAFWPKELAEYTANKTRYLSAVDAVYAAAARNGCRVLLSFFWNIFAVPDLVGEPLGAALRGAGSATRRFMAAYVADVVAVAARHPAAVAAWELGNELNLLADLDMENRTSLIAPAMGTPARRTRADNISTDDMNAYSAWLAGVVRAAARRRGLPTLVSTGHAAPRPAAGWYRATYPCGKGRCGVKPWLDTEAQFAANLLNTSACCELASVHLYPGSGKRWGSADPDSTRPAAVAAAALRGSATQSLYVGEFGDAAPGARPFTHRMLRQLLASGVCLATVWVWDLPQQAATYSLGPTADRALLAEMRRINANSTC